MAQQIAVGSGVKISLIAGAGLFAYGQRNGAVRMLGADGGDYGADALVGKVRVLAALQDEGAEAQGIAIAAAG